MHAAPHPSCRSRCPVLRRHHGRFPEQVQLKRSCLESPVRLSGAEKPVGVGAKPEEKESGGRPATFTVTNGCAYALWPGILSNAGVPPPSTTGFVLSPGQSRAVAVADGWSGRLWGRTLCGPSGAGAFACATGDCGSGTVECSGRGAAPPVTLAEFTLASAASGRNDFYDVSLVDGYNVPVLVAPAAPTAKNGSSCQTTGCPADLNASCPPELRVVGASGAAVACRSACETFGTEEYCCSGAHGTPATCAPTAYSRFFKAACPLAYSYAYDDATSTFTCAGNGDGGGYDVTFCPAASSPNLGANPGAAAPPTTSAAYPPMVFSSADADPATTRHAIILLLVAMTIFRAMSMR